MSADTTERALRVLGLLQSRPGWTASELARDLGVTPRTVRRDVERLRRLGYAVEGDRGASGGYRLARGRAIPPLLFAEDEVVAVGVALQRTAALSDGAESESALRALTKLEATLPAPLRARLADLRSFISHTGMTTATVSPEVLTLIAGAIRGRVRLRFGYVSGRADSLSQRRVEPYRLVAADRGWYLSAFDLDRDDWRLFRLDRMGDVTASTLGFRPRADEPDPVERLRTVPVEAYQHAVRVHIDAPLEQVAQWYGAYSVTLRALGPQRTELLSSTDRPDAVPGWLANLSVPYRVLGDDAVRGAFELTGRRMLAASTRADRLQAGYPRGMPTVTLLCGPAGAGKTTFARQLESGGAVRLSMDEAVWQDGWRDVEPPPERLDALHRELQQRLCGAVAEGVDVVVDLALSQRAIRDEWRTLARTAGADVELVLLTAPIEVLWQRVERRSGQAHANAVKLTHEQLVAYVDGFDWPREDEGVRVILTG